ncbi:MAG: caa(3)-type oxidase subunit IV [Deltaproteobacteria bacterium GWA2_45_12]|nr:MAG: caa(3)-type oxidase subunit IV [Deltaproteobacteria bacterium GWA2_45_12]
MSHANTNEHATEHSHPNYFKIWMALVALLIASVLGPMIGIPWLTLITAFGIAIIKALMVAAYFMHLNVEKKYIWYILLGCLALMIFFFFAIAPDIMNHSGTNWHFIEVTQPAPSHGGH